MGQFFHFSRLLQHIEMFSDFSKKKLKKIRRQSLDKYVVSIEITYLLPRLVGKKYLHFVENPFLPANSERFQERLGTTPVQISLRARFTLSRVVR